MLGRAFVKRGLPLVALLAGSLLAPTAWGDLAAAHAALDAEDYETARREFSRFAEAGDAGAQYNLAVIYHHGLGTPKNTELAMQWFSRAARQRSDRAAHALGLIYAKGLGVEEDLIEAYTWLRVASLWGSQNARKTLYKLGRLMTDEQIDMARQRADELAKP